MRYPFGFEYILRTSVNSMAPPWDLMQMKPVDGDILVQANELLPSARLVSKSVSE